MTETNNKKDLMIINAIAKEIGAPAQYVANVVQLIDEGNTIPFIARYRKEVHGAMDDTKLRALSERLTYLRNLDERKNTVLNAIEEQDKLTEELRAAIEAAAVVLMDAHGGDIHAQVQDESAYRLQQCLLTSAQ